MHINAPSNSSRRYGLSHRTQPTGVAGGDLIDDRDWELQHSSSEAARILCPSSAVITGISGGDSRVHVKGDGSCKIEIKELKDQMGEGCRAIGVTTTIEVEKSYVI